MSTLTAGVDCGSTYTKAVLLSDTGEVLAKAMAPTGFKLAEVSDKIYKLCLAEAGVTEDDVAYVIATGFGRHQVAFRDLHVTDLTATARGTNFLFPGTRTVLDIGGQTMKASRIDQKAKVKTFRLNDKCAAGTGAFLEKTARYMGYETEEIGALLVTSREQVEISGVCAVFAESEVINQLSLGTAPSDIMLGAVESLVGRAVQLMKRAKGEPEYTVIGGLLRWERMVDVIRKQLKSDVNVPEGDMVQFTAALGAAVLGHRRLEHIAQGAAKSSLAADARGEASKAS